MKVRNPHISPLTLTSVAVITLVPGSALASDIAIINFATRELCGYMTGDLGGLLTAAAAFGAVVAAAFGASKAFHSAIISAIGAYSLPSVLSLHFPAAGEACKNLPPREVEIVDFAGPTLPASDALARENAESARLWSKSNADEENGPFD